jgi:outer membrane protein W
MSRRLSNAILVMALYGWMSTAAYAQRDNVELNVFGGGSWFTHKDYQVNFPQTTVPVNGFFHLDRAIVGGVRVGVYTRGHWSEEFFYSYQPNKSNFISTTLTTTPLVLPIHVHNYGITALYYFKEDEAQTVRPYLSIGVGGTLYQLTTEAEAFVKNPLQGNIPEMHSSNELAMNYGFGVKARINNWVGFRADATGYLGAVPSFGLPHTSSDPNAEVLPLTGAIHNGQASAGLVFYFVGRH